jgi:hypothetical protein
VIKQWTEAIVIHILKPGKDAIQPENYRPISLTSCLCKIMERMVNKRLVNVLDERNLIPEQQYGFRKNRSTTDVLNILNREYSAMLSLDISKAYDTCWGRGILNTLKTWKINRRMLGFAKNLMNNRTLRVAVGNTLSSPMSIKNRVVQGAVLNVTFFLVVMATICMGIEEPTRILGYADDWVIYTSQRTPRMTEYKLQKQPMKL